MEANSSDGEQSVPSNSIPFAPDDSCSDKMKDTWHRSPFGMMFVPLTENLGKELLTWFLAAFHAPTCREQKHTTPEANLLPMDWMVNAPAFGLNKSESFVKYDQNSRLWRTSQLCLMGGSEEYSETWPNWGWMHNGECFHLPPLVPQINASECFWLLTPTASDGIKRYAFRCASLAKRYRKHPGGNLAEQVAFLAEQRGVEDGRLNPAFWEWMLGWPMGWASCQPLETAKVQQWQQWHSRF